MKNEEATAKIEDAMGASVARKTMLDEILKISGKYKMECRDKDGNLKWEDTLENLITTVGKNLILDTLLKGAAYSVTGPFLGLISNVSYGVGPAVGDTMASHAGWTEAGGANAPTYTAPRKTAAMNAASGGSSAMTTNQVFAITSGSNVIIKGAFIVLGTGALSTIDNTAGTLYSAAVFSNGDKTVSNGDSLTVSYTTSLT